jgi:mannosyl-3-phosphoglycerate phosphatase
MRALIFTDLDGTLLDEDYSYEDAREALSLIKKMSIPLIIVSSKSYFETSYWKEKLEIVNIHVYEAGFGISLKRGLPVANLIVEEAHLVNYLVVEEKSEILLEFDREEIERKVEPLFDSLGMRPRYIADMTIEEIVDITGLTPDEAKLAKRRRGPSPFLIEPRIEKMVKDFEKKGLFLSKGKYFMLLAPYNKGTAVRIIERAYRRVYGEIRTVGLGDSQADLYFLKEMDIPLWVKGPKDWNCEVRRILREV